MLGEKKENSIDKPLKFSNIVSLWSHGLAGGTWGCAGGVRGIMMPAFKKKYKDDPKPKANKACITRSCIKLRNLLSKLCFC